MVKNAMAKNETATANGADLEVLKKHFGSCFNSDGSLDVEKLKARLEGQVAFSNEGYELKFLGKNYARLLTSLETTTVVVPDVKHNAKPENAKSKNVYISGDNLDALKHLLKSKQGQVKCIYIDPPYNTGSDGFVYNDSFGFKVEELASKLSISEDEAQRILDFTKRGSASHSAWLMFMYPRLMLARDLLAKDGVIFISIDDNEQANCRELCDEIFGEQNFLTCVSRATGTPTGGGFDGLVNELDYVLIYARDIEKALINKLKMTEGDAKIYNQIDEEGHRYLTRSLRRTGGEDRREDRPTMYYSLTAPDGTKIFPMGPTGYESRWICAEETALDLEENGLIEWRKTDWMGKKVWHPYQKYYLDNRMKAAGNIWRDLFCAGEDGSAFLWDEVEGNKKATREIRDLFDGKKVFETAKPVELIEKIIGLGSGDDSLVLDFFSGSATTAHAIMKLNAEIESSHRQYILVQCAEPCREDKEAFKAGYKTIDAIGLARIKKAAAKIAEENPLLAKTMDLGFKHYTLKEVAGKTLDKIEKFDLNDNALAATDDILKEFGVETVLATWLVHDGYGFSAEPKVIDLDGYKAYWMEKHVYLIEPGLSDKGISALFDKFETEGSFNPGNVVVFGYSFSWTQLEALKNNLLKIAANGTNKHVLLDKRY